MALMESLRWILVGAFDNDPLILNCAGFYTAQNNILEIGAMALVALFGVVYGHRQISKIQAAKAAVYTVNDRVCWWLCLAFLLAQVFYKFASGKLLYVFMTCHFHTFICLVAMSGRTFFHNVALLCSVGSVFAPVLAVAYPDTHDLLLPGEVFFFFLQHFGVILIPLFGLYWRPEAQKLLLLNPQLKRAFSYYGSMLFTLYSGPVLFLVSILTSQNLGYQLCPPPSFPLSGPVSYIFPRQSFRFEVGILVNLVLHCPLMELMYRLSKRWQKSPAAQRKEE